ncbi:BlaI/MecI/CopY family transcriptional regulator [Actinacidiphila acidipaludis]|uniref:BlaI/MecI/CopY family transcriptional regulator n=1 Tax=Actinacidiphila acidipaludis TaxID=2873382 RepID=A0ABS7QFN6_9ACTN|nr:BlaI/MecI/CopY family transcriptional regulator [Streptomyces acidipaludis]MBY8881763.1 BlaI/MecI/CopY family transcriptional regulator [Streptomyces acidipaludis]
MVYETVDEVWTGGQAVTSDASRPANGPPQRRKANGVLAAEVLDVLQSAGVPLTPAEVMGRLPEALAYSTVVTTLSRLYAKDVLVRAPRGRAFAYAPAADAAGLAARRMREALEKEPDHATVLLRFLDALSPDDASHLRRLLRVVP